MKTYSSILYAVFVLFLLIPTFSYTLIKRKSPVFPIVVGITIKAASGIMWNQGYTKTAGVLFSLGLLTCIGSIETKKLYNFFGIKIDSNDEDKFRSLDSCAIDYQEIKQNSNDLYSYYNKSLDHFGLKKYNNDLKEQDGIAALKNNLLADAVIHCVSQAERMRSPIFFTFVGLSKQDVNSIKELPIRKTVLKYFDILKSNERNNKFNIKKVLDNSPVQQKQATLDYYNAANLINGRLEKKNLKIQDNKIMGNGLNEENVCYALELLQVSYDKQNSFNKEKEIDSSARETDERISMDCDVDCDDSDMYSDEDVEKIISHDNSYFSKSNNSTKKNVNTSNRERVRDFFNDVSCNSTDTEIKKQFLLMLDDEDQLMSYFLSSNPDDSIIKNITIDILCKSNLDDYCVAQFMQNCACAAYNESLQKFFEALVSLYNQKLNKKK